MRSPQSYAMVVVEDALQGLVFSRLVLQYCDYLSYKIIVKGGRKEEILQRLSNYNNASKQVPHIVFIDLDSDACAPKLIQQHLELPFNPQFMVRILVREVDAWLLADRQNFARFFGISIANIPLNTENIPDPKKFIIELARKGKREVYDIIPIGTGKVGPGYNVILGNFIWNNWNPEIAQKHNDSLARTINRLKKLFSQS